MLVQNLLYCFFTILGFIKKLDLPKMYVYLKKFYYICVFKCALTAAVKRFELRVKQNLIYKPS